MTHPSDNPEIGDALALLEEAERDFPSQGSADGISEAFDALNDILACDEPDAATTQYIGNLKYAHCRRIAIRLADVDKRDFEVWYHYVVLLLVKMKPEIERMRAEHPDLGQLYDRCLGRHGASLKMAAQPLGPDT